MSDEVYNLTIDGLTEQGGMNPEVSQDLNSPETAFTHPLQEEPTVLESTEESLQGATSTSPQSADNDDESLGFGDYVSDIAMTPLRGLEGFTESVASLFGGGWDREKYGLFKKSKTVVGTIGETVVQFGVGMIPGLGTVGLVGKGAKIAHGAKAARAAAKATKFTGKGPFGRGAVSKLSNGSRSVDVASMGRLAKLKPAAKKAAVMSTAGAIADFTAFKGDEARLSNMLKEWGVGGDVIEWMAYDPDRDEGRISEIEGRFKNAIEGLFIGGAIGGGFNGGKYMITALKKFKRKNELMARGLSEEEAVAMAQKEFEEALAKDPSLTKAGTELGEKLAQDKAVIEDGAFPRVMSPKDDSLDELPFGKDDPASAVEGVPPERVPVPKLRGKPAKEVMDDLDSVPEEELDKFLEELDVDIPSQLGNAENKRKVIKSIVGASDNANQVIYDVNKLVDEVFGDDIGKFLGTGEQALRAGERLLKGVKTTDSMVALARALGREAVKKLDEATEGLSSNADDLLDKVTDNINATDGWGMDTAQAQRALKNAEGNVTALRRIYGEQEAIRKLYTALAEKVQTKVVDAESALRDGRVVIKDELFDATGKKLEPQTVGYDEALSEVYNSVDMFLEGKKIWAEYGTNLSLGMLQRKFIMEGTGGGGLKFKSRNLGFDYRVAPKGSEASYRKGIRGSRSEKKFLQMLSEASSLGDIEMRLAKIAPDARRGAAMTISWYLNALLGSPLTWGVNLMGSGLMKAFRDFEVLSGSMTQFAMTGNTDLLRANVKMMFDIESFWEALKYGGISLKKGEPLSISGYSPYTDSRPKAMDDPWSFDAEGEEGVTNLLKQAGNWLGTVVTAPSRVLMAGDEVFKQWNYRSYMKTDLAMEAYRRGIKDPYDVALYVQENMSKAVTENGRFLNESNVYKEAVDAADAKGLKFAERTRHIDAYMDEHFYNSNMRLDDGTIYKTREQRDMQVDRATDWSLINTFTNDVSNKAVRHVQSAALGNQWLALLIPFVRTPTNILTFALSRSFPGLGGFHKNLDTRGMDDAWYDPLTFKLSKKGRYAHQTQKEYAIMSKGDTNSPEFKELEANQIRPAERSKYAHSEWNTPKVSDDRRPHDPHGNRLPHQTPPAAYYKPDQAHPKLGKRPEGVISIDRERLKSMYESKEYLMSKVPGVKPLPEDTFRSYEEFESFVVAHERAHQFVKRRPEESLAAYENRVNKQALKAFEFEKAGGGPGWQNHIKELYADMPFSEAMAKEHLAMLTQGNAREAAEYYGRLQTSIMIVMTAVAGVDTILDRITGGPPKGQAARAAWEADGRKAYSIRLKLPGSDKEKWYSYQRLDPFATILGMFADAAHLTKAVNEDEQGVFTSEDEEIIFQDTMQKIFAVITTTFSRNISNKSYLQNLTDTLMVIKEPGSPETAKRVGGVIAGFVPNYLNWSQNLAQEDPAILESRKLLDGLMKKLPEYMRPEVEEGMFVSSSLMPQRNFLGEVRRKQNKGPVGGWFPGILGVDNINDPSKDIVDQEFHSLGKAFAGRNANWLNGQINTKNFRNYNGGQTAYDRQQEIMSTTKIGGQTLRQSLRKLINSPEYQALTPATDMTANGRHPRHQALEKVIRFYNANAKVKVLREYPELKQQYNSVIRNR